MRVVLLCAVLHAAACSDGNDDSPVTASGAGGSGNGGGAGVGGSAAGSGGALPSGWSPAPPMLAARATHAATLVADGRVLVVGGAEAGEPAAEIFDPVAGAWTASSAPGFAPTLSSPVACPLADGSVLVAAGGSSDTWLWDPATDTWTAAAPMGDARQGAACASLSDGRLLVTGGANGPAALTSAELYDPAAGAWAPAGAMATGRFLHFAVPLDDGRVLVGGADQPPAYEVYDPTTNGFIPVGAGSESRHNPAAVRLGQVVVVIGGLSTGGGSQFPAPVDLIDAAAGSVAEGPTLLHPRFHHGAVLLAGGQGLVAGGHGNELVAEAEQIVSTSGAWTTAGTTLPRHDHTFTALADGGALLAGGFTLRSTKTASVERYVP